MENNRTQSNPIIIRPSQLSLALDREERLGREQEERYKQRLEDFQMMTGRPTGPEDPNGDPNRRYRPDDGDTDYLLRYRYMKEVVAKQYKTHQQAAQHRKEPTPSPTTPSPTIVSGHPSYSPGNLRLIEAPKPITDQPPGPAPQQPWPLQAWLATMALRICGQQPRNRERDDNIQRNNRASQQTVGQNIPYDDRASQNHTKKLNSVLEVLDNKAGIRLNSLQFKALIAIQEMLVSKIKYDLNIDIISLKQNLNVQAPELLRVIYNSTQESDKTKNPTFKDKEDLVSRITNEIRGNFGPRKSGAVTLTSRRSASTSIFTSRDSQSPGRPISAPPMGAKGQLLF